MGLRKPSLLVFPRAGKAAAAAGVVVIRLANTRSTSMDGESTSSPTVGWKDFAV